MDGSGAEQKVGEGRGTERSGGFGDGRGAYGSAFKAPFNIRRKLNDDGTE